MGAIIIHRGTSQIGGIVTEISAGDHRILIDFGSLLPGSANAKISDGELVQFVFGNDADRGRTDAVLFTHYHGDHVGLKKQIPEHVPMYIGRTAKEIMRITASRVDRMKKMTGREDGFELPVIDRMEPYWKLGTGKAFHDITVTPLVCDHSALDAHMFVIETCGKKILYTGDFRNHGIPGEETFEKMIRTYVGKVDILITEGTMVSRVSEEQSNPVRTEEDLGKKAAEIFSAHRENVVLVSSTNLDSVMEFYHATPEDSVFLCDAYQAEIMKTAIEAKNRYYPRVYSYARNIYILCPKVYAGCMNGLEDYTDPRTGRHPFRLAKPELYRDRGIVMLARPNRNPKEKTGHFEKRMAEMTNPFITYSLWSGYLKGGKAEDPDIVRFLEGRTDSAHMECLHTSGHAYVEALRKLMDLTDPEVIIPMHTEDAAAFREVPDFAAYRSRIRTISDREVYPL